MQPSFGWTGQLLRVNLSTNNVTVEPTKAYTAQFLGGRGIGQWILLEELNPSADPLGPDNKLVLGAGPLVGTLAPASGRLSVDWKNPQTGGVGSANAGGHFAPELKFAGFDGVIIEGQAKEPVFLLISDGEAKILSASAIWGKTTWETEHTLREQLNDDRLRVASIGPAGENMVLGACLVVDRARAAGRGGAGVVLGSKKLKAIAVRGTRPIRIYDPEKFIKNVVTYWCKLESSPVIARFLETGTQGGTSLSNGLNCQDESLPLEKFSHIKWEVFRDNFQVRRLACFNCPLHCSRFHKVQEGPYKGTVGEGVEANTLRAFGPNLGVDYAPAIVKGNVLSNQLGIDVDFAAATLGWAFESYQRGVVSTSDTGGLELVWGNYDAALRLLEDIAYKRKFGKILANGVMQASKAIGKGAEEWAMHIKGADLNEPAMREDKAWAFGITIANRGGGHLEGASRMARLNATAHAVTPEVLRERFGRADFSQPNSYEDKEKVVFWLQNLKGVFDSLGLCWMVSHWYGLDLLGFEEMASLLNTATGEEMSPDELMKIGQRIHNVGKAFNTIHAGFGREDDFPPPRLMKEPIKSGPFAGELLHEDQWNKMLDRYYALEGWDISTGRQTPECLHELGLGSVAERLKITVEGRRLGKDRG